ncbi:hypothetical protein YC2023_086750 [Brassica napus]
MQLIFSTALDGKIKAWLYDNMGSRVDYDAPVQWCTTNGVEAMSRTMEKPRILESVEKSRPLELMEVTGPAQCRQLTMPDSKGFWLHGFFYTNSGVGILALGTNGVQILYGAAASKIQLEKAIASVNPAAFGNLTVVMTTFMPPPPASTFLTFHPHENNTIATGMEDSTIHIYNVRVDEIVLS